MLSLSRLSVRRFSSECQQETQHSGNHVTLQREKKHMHVYIQTNMSPLPLTNQRWGRRAVCFFPSMLSSLFPPSQRAGPVSEGISDCCSCSPVCQSSVPFLQRAQRFVCPRETSLFPWSWDFVWRCFQRCPPNLPSTLSHLRKWEPQKTLKYLGALYYYQVFWKSITADPIKVTENTICCLITNPW